MRINPIKKSYNIIQLKVNKGYSYSSDLRYISISNKGCEIDLARYDGIGFRLVLIKKSK